MEGLWFGIAAVMLSVYVVMDGFDFGAGILHLFVARTDAERRQVLSAIGPFWDGNEVWLLASGGVLFLAFPKVLAAGLSGFYLAVMLLIWVLILRGAAIELRSHLGDGMWRAFFDAVFAGASALAPVLLGAALGNILRGVDFDADGWFSLALFDSFSPTGALGLLDAYTVLVGLVAFVALTHHGALFLVWKTDGDVQARSLRWAAGAFPVLVVLWVAATWATQRVSPGLFEGWAARPLAWAASLAFVVGLAVSWRARRAGQHGRALVGSGVFLLGGLAATAASVFPVMIADRDDPAASLTALNAASSPHSLSVALWWWPVGAVLAVAYTLLVFRLHTGKVTAGESAH